MERTVLGPPSWNLSEKRVEGGEEEGERERGIIRPTLVVNPRMGFNPPSTSEEEKP